MSSLSLSDFEKLSRISDFKVFLKSKLNSKKYESIIKGFNYETELLKLQAELVELQQWVAKNKKRI